MGVLAAFLIVEDYLIGSELRGYLMKREMVHSELDLELMGGAALEALLRRDYATVGSFVRRWGREHVDVVSLEATASNGFVLASYKREDVPEERTYELTKVIRHDGRELVTMAMKGDARAIEAVVDSIMKRLMAGSVLFMFCLGAALWFSQKRTALRPLELEVKDRTEDLRRELAERMQAEEKVLEREKEISLLLDSMAEAVYGLDTEGNCTFCNPSCLRMLGHSDSQDLLGRNMHEIMHHTHADGTPYPREQCRVCDAYREGKGVHVDSEILWRSDGTSFPAEYWSYPIISDEGVIGAVVTFLDITRRREAEQERENLIGTLHALVDHMPEGVFLLDDSGKVVMANPVALEYLEAVSGQGVGGVLQGIAGRPPGEFLISPPQILWHDVVSEGRTFEIASRPLKDGGMVFVMRDVTRVRELDKRLRLQERMSAVGQLAAGIAHDFNNILTVINGYTEMLIAEEGHDEETVNALKAIYQSGEKAADLIHQILDFSRQSVGRKQPMDLGEFLKEFMSFIGRAIPEDIDVSLEVDGGPFVVEADETKLQQVFANLVVNARDSMPGGGRLTIRAAAMDFSDGSGAPLYIELAGRRWVLVEVRDTGSGIPEEVLPYIFEPFYTTKDPGHGTGLGLPQVYGLVKQHGGNIHVDTSPEGSSFQVHLPLAEAACRGEEAVKEDEGLPMAEGQRVLVVEDESDVRGLVVNMLSSLGYNVISAANGREALEAFEAAGREVDLAVTDIVMPGMDGISLARELRSRVPGLRVIAISGYATGLSAESLRDAGVMEMIRKPFKIRALAETVSRCLAAEEA
jgi:two-component system NtrC family sensor kinase